MRKVRSQKSVIVVGLGVIGSAAAFHLAARGYDVLGLEQFTIAHDRGSSHGHSRIIRSVNWENPSYVPLAKKSFQQWRDLEKKAGLNLLTMTGGVDIGHSDRAFIKSSLLACRTYNLEHDMLSGEQVNERFPAFNLPDDWAGIFYPEAGILNPENGVKAFWDCARAEGAILIENSKVQSIGNEGGAAYVILENGERHDADYVVVAAGPWTQSLVPDLDRLMQVNRQVVGWFNPARPDFFSQDKLPIFLLREENESNVALNRWYGFPAMDGKPTKFARMNHRDEVVDPNSINRTCTDEDSCVFERLRPFLSSDVGPPVDMQTCMFTNSPDGHFILGFHPQHDNMYIASCCSGHAFKFAPVLGEMIASQIETGLLPPEAALHDIARFKIN